MTILQGALNQHELVTCVPGGTLLFESFPTEDEKKETNKQQTNKKHTHTPKTKKKEKNTHGKNEVASLN